MVLSRVDIQDFCKNPNINSWKNLNMIIQDLLLETATFCIKNQRGDLKMASVILDLSKSPWETVTLPKNYTLFRGSAREVNIDSDVIWFAPNVDIANKYLPSNKKGYLSIFRVKTPLKLFSLNSLHNANKLLRETFSDKKLVIHPHKKYKLRGKTLYDIIRHIYTGIKYIKVPDTKPLQLKKIVRASVTKEDIVFAKWLCSKGFSGWHANLMNQKWRKVTFPAEDMICNPYKDLEPVETIEMRKTKSKNVLAKLQEQYSNKIICSKYTMPCKPVHKYSKQIDKKTMARLLARTEIIDRRLIGKSPHMAKIKMPVYAPKKADRIPKGIIEAHKKYGAGEDAAFKAADLQDWGATKALILEDGGRARYVDEFGRLPLHIALEGHNPDLDVISLLIKKYPEGIRHKTNEEDDWARLPLHYAQTANLDIINLLLQEYPDSVKVKDGLGDLLIHGTAGDKASDGVISLLIKKYPESLNIRNHENLLPVEIAEENGQEANLKELTADMKLSPKSGTLSKPTGSAILRQIEPVKFKLPKTEKSEPRVSGKWYQDSKSGGKWNENIMSLAAAGDKDAEFCLDSIEFRKTLDRQRSETEKKLRQLDDPILKKAVIESLNSMKVKMRDFFTKYWILKPDERERAYKNAKLFIKNDCDKAFLRGDKIAARYRGGNKWFNAEIVRAYSNSRYDIIYEDGDREKNVKSNLLRHLPSARQDCIKKCSRYVHGNYRCTCNPAGKCSAWPCDLEHALMLQPGVVKAAWCFENVTDTVHNKPTGRRGRAALGLDKGLRRLDQRRLSKLQQLFDQYREEQISKRHKHTGGYGLPRDAETLTWLHKVITKVKDALEIHKITAKELTKDKYCPESNFVRDYNLNLKQGAWSELEAEKTKLQRVVEQGHADKKVRKRIESLTKRISIIEVKAASKVFSAWALRRGRNFPNYIPIFKASAEALLILETRRSPWGR